MTTQVFGPSQIMKYFGMGNPEDIAAGQKQFQADFEKLTANAPRGQASLAPIPGAPAGFSPMFLPELPKPAGSPLQQAMADRQMAQAPQGVMGAGGVLGMQPPLR